MSGINILSSIISPPHPSKNYFHGTERLKHYKSNSRKIEPINSIYSKGKICLRVDSNLGVCVEGLSTEKSEYLGQTTR